MATKRQRRYEEIKDKKKKKSTRILYFSLIMGGISVVLICFFVILFNALFPPVDMDAKKKQKHLVVIYFSDPQERFLVPEKRYVYIENNSAQQAREITKALLDGSKTGLINTFPAKVSLRDVKVNEEGTAFINFSKNLTKLHPGGSSAEMATIYSLTNSVTENISSIKRVKILVEGKELPSIKGHISTNKTFIPNPELFVPTREENS